MTQKNYKSWTLAFLIVTVAALVVTAAMLSLKKDVLAVQGAPQPKPDQADTVYYTPNPLASQGNSGGEELSGGYYITIYKGHVGAFKAGEAQPVLTAPAEVYLLPKEDLELLRRGIWAKDLKEARGILEDYE